MPKTEAETRRAIDNAWTRAGWAVQSQANANLWASRGVAVEELPLATGEADYLLSVDGQVAGVVEAKREGETLTGVEIQSEKYSAGLPPDFSAKVRPLPFLFESDGVETRLTNRLDPDPRSRPLFAFPKPTGSESEPNGRWRKFSYEELIARDKVSIDLSWVRGESLDDGADLTDPDEIAREIIEDLQAALEEFALIQADLSTSA